METQLAIIDHRDTKASDPPSPVIPIKRVSTIKLRKQQKNTADNIVVSLISDDEDGDAKEIPKKSDVTRKRARLCSPPTNADVADADGKTHKIESEPPALRKKQRFTSPDGTISASTPSATPKNVARAASGIFSPRSQRKPPPLDRKEMERERLARNAQKAKMEAKYHQPITSKKFYGTGTRKPSVSGASSLPTRQYYGASGLEAGGGDSGDRFMAIKTTKPPEATVVDSDEEGDDDVEMVASPRYQPSTSSWYPKGTVKKTFIENKPRTANDITIQEVLQKDTLVTTLLSSFQWDYEWFMRLLPLHKQDHSIVLVMQGKEEADRRMKEAIFKGLPRVELVFPNMDGQVNCMHSKLMLLFHKDGNREWLRVVVPTANMTDYDWGQMGGIMENVGDHLSLGLENHS